VNILDTIVEKRKERISADKKRVPECQLKRYCKAPQSFFKTDNLFTLIAECKKASPSKGIFVRDYDPVSIAVEYEKGGADTISVLTEPEYFLGDNSHLSMVSNAVSIPILRKDFIIDPYQIKESWSLGADAVLLIAAILSKQQLIELISVASEYGLEVLVEVHTEQELETAINAGSNAVGINARNLKDFTIDMALSQHLFTLLPENTIAVAESGIKSPDDGLKMLQTGFRGFLIGEYFMTAQDKAGCVSEFRSVLMKNIL